MQTENNLNTITPSILATRTKEEFDELFSEARDSIVILVADMVNTASILLNSLQMKLPQAFKEFLLTKYHVTDTAIPYQAALVAHQLLHAMNNHPGRNSFHQQLLIAQDYEWSLHDRIVRAIGEFEPLYFYTEPLMTVQSVQRFKPFCDLYRRVLSVTMCEDRDRAVVEFYSATDDTKTVSMYRGEFGNFDFMENPENPTQLYRLTEKEMHQMLYFDTDIVSK